MLFRITRFVALLVGLTIARTCDHQPSHDPVDPQKTRDTQQKEARQ